MNLLERERVATRVCFARQPDPADLEALGAPERWRTYRSMVRARLERVVSTALARTVRQLGDERFAAMVADWLADAPPTQRYFREVPMGFLAHHQAALDADEARPWLGDLARFEMLAWRVRYADDRHLPPVVELSFERPIVLHPSVELLDLRYDVQPHGELHHDDYPAKALHVLMFRDDQERPERAAFRAVTLILNPLARDLVRAWRDHPEETLTALTQRVAAARDTAIDERFIEGLAGLLEDYLRRGVVLGSRGA